MMKLRATIVLFLMAAVAVQADVVITDFADEAERDSFLSTTTVVGYEELRSGLSSKELQGGPADGNFTTSEDLTWSRNNEHDFILSYDSAGNLNLVITPPESAPVSISYQPSSWFNVLAFSIESNATIITGVELKNLTIDSEPFRTLSTSGFGGWDGLLFEFSSNGPTNVPEFEIFGTFTPSSPVGFSGGDEFKGEFYLAQVEESGPSSVTVASVTESEWNDTLGQRVWHAQFQPGSGSRETHQFEIGDGETATEVGSTSWSQDPASNPFTLSIDNANNLTLSANGATTSPGLGFPVSESFNEVWIFVESLYPFDPAVLSLKNMTFDGASLPDISIPGDGWVGIKVISVNELNNLAEILISGELVQKYPVIPVPPNEDDWTANIVGVYNPDLEAEVTPIDLGSFAYDHVTGAALLTLQAAPSAAYVLKQSTDPGDFTSATTITPTAVTTGTLDANQITTDTTGKAVIQFNLGTAPRMFVRGERP
jgi:hypothetical protein